MQSLLPPPCCRGHGFAVGIWAAFSAFVVMSKETALLDLASQGRWTEVGRLLKDKNTKISAKQINRVGRCD